MPCFVAFSRDKHNRFPVCIKNCIFNCLAAVFDYFIFAAGCRNILGYFAASTFSKYVTQFDHWIIFALLVFIGGNMVHEAFEEDEENSKETAQFDWKHMLPLAVACSIDAFAVGVSLAFMFTKAHMAFAILSIGVVTGLFSAAGLHIGRAFGSRWQKPAQIAGGVVLILLGIKVLLEHLGVIAF